jgi:hypothetical protein
MLLIAVAALAAPAAVSAAGHPSHTKTHIYEPFTANGKPAVHVSKTVHGSCFAGSIAAIRSDAWRCMAGNNIFDPCFSSSKAGGYVLCSLGPWQASVKLDYSGHLSGGNHGHASMSRDPWAVETTDGKKCMLGTGTADVIGHRASTYFCQHSSAWLWGDPARSSQPWKIYEAPLTAHTLTKKVGITVAWF